MMISDQDLDRKFFEALVRKDGAFLAGFLADDFRLADLSGALLARPDFIALLQSGDLVFVAITPHEAESRVYGETGIQIGRTTMKVLFKGQEMVFESRYTHVYATLAGRRRLVSAQGTPIQPGT